MPFPRSAAPAQVADALGAGVSDAAENRLILQAKPTTVAISVEQGAVAVGDLRGAITLMYAPPRAGHARTRARAHARANATGGPPALTSAPFSVSLWSRSFCLGDSADPAAASNAVRTVAHWHAHAVRTVAFSPDGAYMLSGGDEAVLVVWQMGTMAKVSAPLLVVRTRIHSLAHPYTLRPG